MFSWILSAIMWKYVVLIFYLFTVGISVWLSDTKIKLEALSATEPKIDCAIVIGIIFRAYGEIWLKIDSDQIKLIKLMD